MYAWYTRTNDKGQTRLELTAEAFFAGCNNGMIAIELKEMITPNDIWPFGWTIPVAEKWNKQNLSFVLDIKPNSSEAFLCELDRAFGYCYDGWTSIMLRLKILLQSHEPVNKRNFICRDNPEIIYSMLYLSGSVENGQMVGTWKAPHGMIKSLLFWPEAMTFFVEQIMRWDPEFLNRKGRNLSSHLFRDDDTRVIGTDRTH
ncbi:MAG TPA: hypothetical protein VF191_04175 [Cyclobacteriaceae bacterium]